MRLLASLVALALLACSDEHASEAGGSGAASEQAGTGGVSGVSTAGVTGGGGRAGSPASDTGNAGGGGSGDPGDAGGGAGSASTPRAGTGSSPPVSVAVPDLDGEVVRCIDTAPPDSFEPDLQWSFGDAEGRNNSYVTPLVGNLTDDDGDGEIDLNDIPDVVVVLFGASVSDARLVALDGATGALHWISEAGVRDDIAPALGDLDGDGVPEIVSITRESSNWRVGNLIAFDHDGRVKWTGDLVDQSQLDISIDLLCLALADLDADGSPEILAGNAVYDAKGALSWKAPIDPPFWSATTAADLDGDGLLELVLGNAAFHADGSEYFVRDDLQPGYPQVADFDGDGKPEIALLGGDGLHFLRHDGTTISNTAMNVTGGRRRLRCSTSTATARPSSRSQA